MKYADQNSRDATDSTTLKCIQTWPVSAQSEMLELAIENGLYKGYHGNVVSNSWEAQHLTSISKNVAASKLFMCPFVWKR